MNKSAYSIRIYWVVALFCCGLTICSYNAWSQSPDTTQLVTLEFITDQLENIAEKSDMELDYSDLIEEYLFYAKNPINLNGKNLQALRNMYLINDIQLIKLNYTLRTFGPLVSIYELAYIPGFDEETIKNMLPFVTIKPPQPSAKNNFKNALKYGHNQLLIRYEQVLEKRAGYSIPSDSALFFPGSAYLGSPQRYYTRYAFNYKNKLRFGFTLDKDPGEPIWRNQLPDTLQQLIGKKVGPAFDFFSIFAYGETDGFVKQVVIGDYHLEFGQGLTLWSGLAFGKSSEAIQIRKYGRGIKPNTSANENRFFRGGAVTVGHNQFRLTGFYSSNHIDSNIERDVVNQDEGVTSITETGLHRTINELLDKNSLAIQAYGAHIAYQSNILQMGATVFETKTGTAIIPSEEAYKLFNFSGNKLTNFGTDISLNFNRLNFFSEISLSSNNGKAVLAGLNTFLTERILFTFLYHHYGKSYQNIYNNPFYESSAIANEQGIYIGFKALVSKNLNLSGYLDHYQFPWLKYRVDAPSTGHDYLLQLTFTPKKAVKAYFRVRFKEKQENIIRPYDYTKFVTDVLRHEYRFYFAYEVWPTVTFKNRIEMVYFKKDPLPAETGFLIYQDILYRPITFPMELTFRYAIFGTDGYESRIYTYENDVLYAFSVPSFFGDGQRIYLMAKYRLTEKINIWLRLAQTTYFNKNTISSGAEEISGNHRTEVKAEIKIKL